MDYKQLQTDLATWYAANQRVLPWRGINDPYRIWISEIILQQTRVAQGYDYYLRFVGRFPDVRALAQASEDEVLRLWQGLGYYSRARNLHAAAQQVVARHQGVFPTTWDDVRALKGIGDYTAAAICSFAYGTPVAVVDGNVYRVLARLFAIDVPIDSTEGKKLFASLAADVLDVHHPAQHNQALMELGALQCVPTHPRCDECPLQAYCMAYPAGLVATLPVKAGKTRVRDRYFTYLLLHNKGTFPLHKRGENDIWRHLYELPLIETDSPLTVDALLQNAEFSKLTAHCGRVDLMAHVPAVKHVLSHQRIHAQLFVFDLQHFGDALQHETQTTLAGLDNFAVSRLTEMLLEQYAAGGDAFTKRL